MAMLRHTTALCVVLAVLLCSTASCGTVPWKRATSKTTVSVDGTATRRLTHDDLLEAVQRDPTVLDAMLKQCEEDWGSPVAAGKEDPALASCHMLGRYYEAQDKNYKQAARMYKRACTRSAEACTDLGLLYHTGQGVEENIATALQQYHKACEFPTSIGPPDANGCRAVGLLYLTGEKGAMKNLRLAKTALRRACKLGNQRGCHELGTALWKPGDAVGVETERAVKLQRRACDDGDVAEACMAYADILADGHGVERDLDKSCALLSKACELELAPSCTRLAMMTEYGFGSGRQPPQAAGLYQRACDLGEPMACSALGTALMEGNEGMEIDQDVARGAALLSKACLAEFQPACEKLDVFNLPRPVPVPGASDGGSGCSANGVCLA